MRIAEQMQPFVNSMEMLGSIASALDPYFPGASAIFRVIKSIFLASKALVDLQQYLVELIVDRVSGNLHLIAMYCDVFPSSPEVLSAALDIYTVVLDIGCRAAQFFYDDKGNRRNGLLTMVRISWSSCRDDLEALRRKFDVRIGNFERAAQLALSQTTTSGLQTLYIDHSRQDIHLRQLQVGLSQQTRLLLDDKTERNNKLTAAQGNKSTLPIFWFRG